MIRGMGWWCLVMFCSCGLVQAQDMALSGVLIDGQDWQEVSHGHKFTEGPAADPQGRVYFTDVPNSQIFKIDLDGKVSIFAENTAQTNGLMFGPDGKLYGCRNGDKQIVAYDVATAKHEVIASDVSSNDLVVNNLGGIYFTDPGAGRVWYISPDRQKKVVAEGLKPNGVILWRDGGTLVVTDAQEPCLWTFRVEADGGLSNKDRYYGPLTMVLGATSTGSDGMTLDSVGRLYVTTRAGLQMFDPTGRKGGVILKPDPNKPLSNVCFGGEKLDTLYVTAGDKVFRRNTQTTGFLNYKKSGQ